MKFTKMEGLGNDYVYVDCTQTELDNPNEVARRVSDRHFGIGSDGLILIKSSAIADFKMDMYNADGSQGEMCGNGIRCVGKFVHDKGLTDKTTIIIETLAGIKTLWLTVEEGKTKSIKVDMGEPILKPNLIPINSDAEQFVGEAVEVNGATYRITGVSMGNPHAIIYVDDVASLDLEKIGTHFENHVLFPNRINTEFVEIVSENYCKMRVWERGAGETFACGTGTCATVVANVLNGRTNRSCEVELLGGNLFIEWNEADNHVYMTGPAEFVFEGNYVL
ncbi:MAG: diaminopimelate epimerase [Mangrovibacterium sp.]